MAEFTLPKNSKIQKGFEHPSTLELLESRKINDTRFKNQQINTDPDSLEVFPYKIKNPISAESIFR
mgnify:CR=1 FL=1